MNKLNVLGRTWIFSPLTLGDVRCLERAGPPGGLFYAVGREWLASCEATTLAVWLCLQHRHAESSLETAALIVASAPREQLDGCLAAALGTAEPPRRERTGEVFSGASLPWPTLYRRMLREFGLRPGETDALTLEQLDWLTSESYDQSNDDWYPCHDYQQALRLRARRNVLTNAQAEKLTELPAELRRQIHTLDDAAWQRFVGEQLDPPTL